MWRLFALLALISLLTGSVAQKCIADSATEVRDALRYFPMCSNYVANKTVFLPQFGYPDYILEGTNSIVRLMGHKIPDSPTFPPICADQALQYFCSFVFRPCSAEGLPRPLCQSACLSFTSICRIVVSSILESTNQSAIQPLLLPDCYTAIESGSPLLGSAPEIVGQPVFPEDSQLWNVSVDNGTTFMQIPVSCNTPDLVSPIPNFFCYGAWGKNPFQRESYCYLLCPVPVITRRAMYIAKTLMLVFGIAGFVCGLFIFVLRIAVPMHRAYPARLVLCCIGCLTWAALWLIVPFMRKGGWWAFECRKGDLNDTAITVFDAIFTVFNDLAFCLYWAAVSLHTLLAVQYGSEIFSWKTELATHCICAGIPVICACIAAGRHLLSATPFTPWAGFTAGALGDPWGNWPQYFLFWGGVVIADLVSIVCVTIVLVKSLRRQVDGHRMQWRRNIRIFVFIIVLIFVESFKIAYKLRADIRTLQLDAATRDYIQGTIFDPRTPRGERIGDGEGILFLTIIEITPLFVSLVFIVNPAISKHWLHHVRNRSNPFTSSASTTDSGGSTTTGAKSGTASVPEDYRISSLMES